MHEENDLGEERHKRLVPGSSGLQLVGRYQQVGILVEVTCGGASKEEHVCPLPMAIAGSPLPLSLVPVVICGEGSVSMTFIDLCLGKDG